MTTMSKVICRNATKSILFAATSIYKNSYLFDTSLGGKNLAVDGKKNGKLMFSVEVAVHGSSLLFSGRRSKHR